MTKSLQKKKVFTIPHSERDAACLPLTQTENEKSKNSELKEVLSVTLLVLDSLIAEIGSKDQLLLALFTVRNSVKNDPVKKGILRKLETYLKKEEMIISL
jgi:hypothetical protein